MKGWSWGVLKGSDGFSSMLDRVAFFTSHSRRCLLVRIKFWRKGKSEKSGGDFACPSRGS
jgi:hypothetical protein